MPKMMSLEMPKRKPQEMKMDIMSPNGDKYPYGTRITLEDKMAKKFDCLEGCAVGDKVCLECEAEIIHVDETKRDGKKTYRVELQITDMSIEPDEDGAMDDGFEKGSDEGDK